MSPGGEAGTRLFTNYQQFQQPLMVHFGERGAVAPALGIGSLVICGCSGPEVLEEVHNVPELACLLLSADAAERQVPAGCSDDVQRSYNMQHSAAYSRERQSARQCALPQAEVVEVHSDAANAGTAEAAEAVRWQAADQVEIDATLQLGTWESGGCVLPAGKQALPTHFVQNLERDG
jgi:hypothetical protein